MDPWQLISVPVIITAFPSISSLVRVEPERSCDAFGKQHCFYNGWSAWLLFGLRLLLVFTNARNIMRCQWVNTDAICLPISVLNVLHGVVIVTRSMTRSLRNLSPFNQFEVHIYCVWKRISYRSAKNVACIVAQGGTFPQAQEGHWGGDTVPADTFYILNLFRSCNPTLREKFS